MGRRIANRFFCLLILLVMSFACTAGVFDDIPQAFYGASSTDYSLIASADGDDELIADCAFAGSGLVILYFLAYLITPLTPFKSFAVFDARKDRSPPSIAVY